MDLNTRIERPDWLTDEDIKQLREDITKCSNPYTDEELNELPFDEPLDMNRANARTAIDILTKYNLL